MWVVLHLQVGSYQLASSGRLAWVCLLLFLGVALDLWRVVGMPFSSICLFSKHMEEIYHQVYLLFVPAETWKKIGKAFPSSSMIRSLPDKNFFFLRRFFLFWCGPIFKSISWIVTILLLFYALDLLLLFWQGGMWYVSSLTRVRNHILWIGRWSLNHWTAREVPDKSFLF